MAKKSGYECLKEKVAKLEAKNDELTCKNADLERDVKNQSKYIADLQLKVSNCDLDKSKAILDMQRTIDEMYEHMGGFRRWLWDLHHEEF